MRQRRTRRGTRKDFPMVASNKTRRVVCTLVRVAEQPPIDTTRFVRKPSALVPWADPYIAGLVRRLQSEVRLERAALASAGTSVSPPMFDDRGAAMWLSDPLRDDLDPPSPADLDWEWSEPRWTAEGEPAE
jgi:hypothetical protein